MPPKPLAALVALVLILAAPAHAAPGDLDPTFGNDGSVSFPFQVGDNGSWGNNEVHGVVLQPDGRIVLAGEHIYGPEGMALARLNIDGTLDATFGCGGTVKTVLDDGGSSAASAAGVALQPDGKIVVVGTGWRSVGNVDLLVARYLTNGTLDPTFGTDGLVMTSFGPSGATGQSLALQADGKIVTAGFARVGGRQRFVLVRYDTSGNLDPTFGTAGVVMPELDAVDSYGYAVAVQPDSRIVATGGTVGGASPFVLLRLQPDGTPDATFGTAGVVTEGGPSGRPWTLLVQRDGRIIAAGNEGTTFQFVLARYEPDGRVDTDFGTNGLLTTPVGGCFFWAGAIAMQPDDQLLTAGYALARYDASGRLDSTFGSLGSVALPRNTLAATVAAQPDGKIVVAGTREDDVDDHPWIVVARYIGGDLCVDGPPGSTCAPSTTSTSTSSSTSTSFSTSTSSSTFVTSTEPPVVTTSSTSTSVLPSTTTTTVQCREGAERDCDDGDSCTEDRCAQGVCVSVQEPGVRGLRCRLDETERLLRAAPSTDIGPYERRRLLGRVRAIRRLADKAERHASNARLREALTALGNLDRALQRDTETRNLSPSLAAAARRAIGGTVAALREVAY